MSLSEFLTQENIQLLWEIIIDECLVMKIISSSINKNDIVLEIQKIFETNLQGFYNHEKNKTTTLVELNKKYIMTIIQFLIKNYQKQTTLLSESQTIPLTETQTQYKKIKIHDDLVKQSITYEEIQNERLSKFESELSKKQQDFTDAMKLPVPIIPKFSDDFLDKPINEMEIEIKKIQEQRNYDIEIINKDIQTNSSNWLKSQETNIKNEKFNTTNINSISNNKTKNETNDNNNIIINFEENNTNEKHITWADPISELNFETNSETISIFNKLKKINVSKQENYQIQIDDLKNEINNINNKLNIILEILNKNKN